MTSAPHSRRYSSFRPLIFADPKKTQEQWTYIAQMGSRTAFKLDADATPRAEFTRVAVHYLGWVSYPMRNNHIHILSVQRTDARAYIDGRRPRMVHTLEEVLRRGLSVPLPQRQNALFDRRR